MTKLETLQKAIDKAIVNGWIIDDRRVLKADAVPGEWIIEIWFSEDIRCDAEISKYHLIYRHDFAKAFWKEERQLPYLIGKNENEKLVTLGEGWKFHLQQLVIQEDALKYLERFL